MQDENNGLLTLPFDTWSSTDEFQVSTGCVNIYIVTRQNGKSGEEIFLYQASAGEKIPAYSYQDRSYMRWSFILKAATEKTSVKRTGYESGEACRLEFLTKTAAADYMESEQVNSTEIFSQSLLEWYQEKVAFGDRPIPPAVKAEIFDPEIKNITDVPKAENNRTEEKNKIQEDVVKLERRDVFSVKQNHCTSICVSEGCVQVYLTSKYGSDVHRALCVGRVQAPCTVPAFFYMDQSHTVWFFQLIAEDQPAELQCQNEAADMRQFLDSCGQPELARKLEEGEKPADMLIDWYSSESMKPIPSKIDIPKEKVVQAGPAYEQSSSLIYRVVAHACEVSKIDCLSEEALKSACPGQELTVERIAEASHFICRSVVLEENWWKDDCGTIIGTIDKKTVACIPCAGGKYKIYDGTTGKTVKLSDAAAKTIHPSAVVIARTLPGRKCSKRDIWDFCLKEIRGGDLAAVGVLALIGTLIGILIPTLNQKIYDDYIPLGNLSQLIQICTVIGSFMIGNMFMEMVKNLTEYRIGSRISYNLQNAAIYRSFRLPEKFFRNYDSADLTNRILQLDEIATAYTDTFVSGGFTVLFSLGYLYKLFTYSHKLAWISLAALVTVSLLFYALSVQAARYEKTVLQKKGDADSRLFQYLNAIDKIRLAGAENKAAARYLLPMKEREVALIKKNRFTSFSDALRGITVTVITMLFYYIIIKKQQTISLGNFTAFNSAFGTMAGAVMGFVDGLVRIYVTQPNLQRIMPLFECAAEYAEGDGQAQYVTSGLNGRVELKDVSFRYSENLPLVLNNLNMTFESGEYIGIVGKSGCGKSTLFKLLLGFETPNNGAVLYDGNNLRDMDKKSFRRNLGVVLQNGKLINGSILENITVTRPKSTRKEVNAVIKAVGLEDDIKQMPMGLQTMLNENCSTISGGQQQSILIPVQLSDPPKYCSWMRLPVLLTI